MKSGLSANITIHTSDAGDKNHPSSTGYSGYSIAGSGMSSRNKPFVSIVPSWLIICEVARRTKPVRFELPLIRTTELLTTVDILNHEATKVTKMPLIDNDPVFVIVYAIRPYKWMPSIQCTKECIPRPPRTCATRFQCSLFQCSETRDYQPRRARRHWTWTKMKRTKVIKSDTQRSTGPTNRVRRFSRKAVTPSV